MMNAQISNYTREPIRSVRCFVVIGRLSQQCDGSGYKVHFKALNKEKSDFLSLLLIFQLKVNKETIGNNPPPDKLSFSFGLPLRVCVHVCLACRGKKRRTEIDHWQAHFLPHVLFVSW